MGISLCSKETIAMILGQVRVVLMMGISPRSLGISLCFRGVICGDPRTGFRMVLVVGISPKSLGNSLCFRDKFRWYLVMGISLHSLGISQCFTGSLWRVGPFRGTYKGLHSPLDFPYSLPHLHVYHLLLSYCSCLSGL